MRTHQFKPMKHPELPKQNRKRNLRILLHSFTRIRMVSEINKFGNFDELGYGKEIVATPIVLSCEEIHPHEMQHAPIHRYSLYKQYNSLSRVDPLIHVPEPPMRRPLTLPSLKGDGKRSASINESTDKSKVSILLKTGHESLRNISIQVNENGVRHFHIKESSIYFPNGVYTP